MADLSNVNSTKMGTAGGLVCVVLFSVTRDELMKTAVLAAFGAVVSFGVSVALKHLLARRRKKKP